VILAIFPVGDPTVVGWTTFALYLLASAGCLRCGLTNGDFKNHSAVRQMWRVQAGVLLFLGLNKQLDLQTPLIQFGKRLALSLGWHEYRGVIEIAFFAGLVAVIGLLVVKHSKAARSFARKHPLTASGDVLVGAYILIRTIYMDHLGEMMGFDLDKVPGLWSVEILGLVLVISGAIFQPSLTRKSP
jgi:hypothetical protein